MVANLTAQRGERVTLQPREGPAVQDHDQPIAKPDPQGPAA